VGHLTSTASSQQNNSIPLLIRHTPVLERISLQEKRNLYLIGSRIKKKLKTKGKRERRKKNTCNIK